MKVYILDEMFFNATTEYTGEEIIVYPVKLNIFEINKLKQAGIEFTTDPREAGDWVRSQEFKMKRDFGGCVVTNKGIKLSVDWDGIKGLKEEEKKEETKGKSI